jgi:transcriptional regulator with PAS, ATPase and Fis domain
MINQSSVPETSLLEIYRLSEDFVSATLNGIVIYDNKGDLIYINDSAKTILKEDLLKAFGTLCTDFYLPANSDYVVDFADDKNHSYQILLGGKTLLISCIDLIAHKKKIGTLVHIEYQKAAERDLLINKLQNIESQMIASKIIIDNIIDGVVLVDKDGTIVYLNKAYQDYLGVSIESAIGRNVKDVIENTRMHIVVQTGEEEIGYIQKIKGKNMVAMRIPIYQGGEIIGAIGQVMFWDIGELKALNLRLSKMEGEIKHYKNELQKIRGARYSFNNIIGDSKRIRKAKEFAKQVAASNSTVMIFGESGTGKELFAQAIHNSSMRKYGPFVPVNCASIPKTLFESELFGYAEGAFTGADKKGKPGKFEIADGGTIFLDEVTELSMEAQSKMLRVIQEKEIVRIGSNVIIPLDVRIITASNENIENLVAKGCFRRDLFYRLNVLRIDLPPLREMIEDFPILVTHLLHSLNRKMGTKVKTVDCEVLKIFEQHNWPGNIREMLNVLERGVNVCMQGVLKKEHLPIYINDSYTLSLQSKSDENDISINNLRKLLNQTEKEEISKALQKTGNNKRKSAKLLGIHRSALYQKIEKYEL